MKKAILIMAMLGGCLTQALAQTDDAVVYRDTREDFILGIKAGINGSNVWDEQGQDFRANPKVGFVGGAFLSIPIGKYIGVQPEVLYSQKGFQASGTLLGSTYSFTRTTGYIDVPVMLQVKVTPAVTLLGGPIYAYLVNQNTTYQYGSNYVEQQQQFQNDNIRKNIFGAQLGADIIVSPFVISGRAGWDLQNNNGDGSSSTPRYRNQWLQLTLGYQL